MKKHILVGALFLLPALHPLLIPVVGLPSHLLWWAHVLPVALLTFRGGRVVATASLILSTSLLVAGEAMFGGGYGVGAPPGTIVALATALTATNLLVVVFALYARGVSLRYQLLFDRVQIGVVQVGAGDRIERMNPAAAALLGVDDRHLIIGRAASDIVPVPGVASLRELEARGAWTGDLHFEGSASSGCLHALIAAAADPESDQYQLFIADRSIEAMHQQEIARQARLSSLGEALADVAHELNNPLASIMAHAQLGRMEGAEDEDPVQLFSVIDRESRRMKGLVSELVGFARPAEGVDCADIDEVVDRIIRVQRVTLGKRIRITQDLRAGATVPIGAGKIEQVLLNLISNAAYVVRRDGTEVNVRTSREDGWVRVEVRDDGPGIDEDIHARLFEPFTTTKPEGEGTGLGLAISRRLARSWGGDLAARNLEPRGAAFELRLPGPFGCGRDARDARDEHDEASVLLQPA